MAEISPSLQLIADSSITNALRDADLSRATYQIFNVSMAQDAAAFPNTYLETQLAGKGHPRTVDVTDVGV
jgi:hypothetical protein